MSDSTRHRSEELLSTAFANGSQRELATDLSRTIIRIEDAKIVICDPVVIMAKPMTSAPRDPSLRVYEPDEAPHPRYCVCHEWACEDLIFMAKFGHHPVCPCRPTSSRTSTSSQTPAPTRQESEQ